MRLCSRKLKAWGWKSETPVIPGSPSPESVTASWTALPLGEVKLLVSSRGYTTLIPNILSISSFGFHGPGGLKKNYFKLLQKIKRL